MRLPKVSHPGALRGICRRGAGVWMQAAFGGEGCSGGGVGGWGKDVRFQLKSVCV